MTEQELWNEEESDKRMNVIAQNGNDGLHYSEEDSDPYAEALNSVNECLVKLAERTQIIEEKGSEAQTLDKIQYTPKDSDQNLNFFIFRIDASLAFGNSRPVINSITFEVSGPETLMIATPDIPGPDESA